MKHILQYIIFSLLILPTQPALANSPVEIPKIPNGLEGGDIFQISGFDTVYYYGFDEARHPYPNQNIFFTWHSDFGGLKKFELSDVEIPLGKPILYRPGSKLIKVESSPTTYSVGEYGILYALESEEQAELMYGVNWNKYIHDIDPSFFFSYTEYQGVDPYGKKRTMQGGGTVHPNGTLVRFSDEMQHVYLIENGMKRHVDPTYIETLFRPLDIHTISSDIYKYFTYFPLTDESAKYYGDDSQQYTSTLDTKKSKVLEFYKEFHKEYLAIDDYDRYLTYAQEVGTGVYLRLEEIDSAAYKALQQPSVNVSIDEDELVAARQLAADLPESWLRLVNIYNGTYIFDYVDNHGYGGDEVYHLITEVVEEDERYRINGFWLGATSHLMIPQCVHCLFSKDTSDVMRGREF